MTSTKATYKIYTLRKRQNNEHPYEMTPQRETAYKNLNITIVFNTIDYLVNDEHITDNALQKLHFQTIVTKSPGKLCTFLLCTKLSPPSSPRTMLFFVRSTCGNGKISRAQQRQVSHRRNNIVLEGLKVHVR